MSDKIGADIKGGLSDGDNAAQSVVGEVHIWRRWDAIGNVENQAAGLKTPDAEGLTDQAGAVVRDQTSS